MERIKQALERARAERQGNPAPVAINTAAAPAPEAHVQNLRYSQTREVDIPDQKLRANRVVTSFEPCEFTDAYNMLRTQVLQRLSENNWNVLAVTSPGSGEGKSLTALNLAASLAMEVNYTVLLVDADLRHPKLHEHLGLEAGQGLSDYLLDDTPLPELLIHPANIDHLTVLPGGRAMRNSAEMLNSPKMSRLVEEMKNRYPSRIVIFDLPPVLNTADAMAFAPYVDATLLVVEEGKTTRKEVQHALDLLSATNVIGTVLNKAGHR
jgi:exopolysaccharide/PEP-CTERM locus tyrosine autokinase